MYSQLYRRWMQTPKEEMYKIAGGVSIRTDRNINRRRVWGGTKTIKKLTAIIIIKLIAINNCKISSSNCCCGRAITANITRSTVTFLKKLKKLHFKMSRMVVPPGSQRTNMLHNWVLSLRTNPLRRTVQRKV